MVDGLFAKYENKPKGQKKREVGEAVPYGRMGRAEDLTARLGSRPEALPSLIAEALGAVFDDTSVSDIFDGENLA